MHKDVYPQGVRIFFVFIDIHTTSPKTALNDIHHYGNPLHGD